MFFAKPLQRSNLCASHRQRRWLTHGELSKCPVTTSLLPAGTNSLLLQPAATENQN